jgi:putative intracellular protease/amidase
MADLLRMVARMPLVTGGGGLDAGRMRIEIVVFDGFDELDAFGPFEVFSIAGFDVELVAVERPGQVTGKGGAQLLVPAVLGQADGVVVPGGGWLNRAAVGSWAEAQRGVLPARLAELAPSTRWLASVCTGGMLLATAGLLTGRRATTNRNAYEELRAHDVTVLDQRVVDDGDRITAGALSAGLDLGLWITERELGAAAAERVATAVEYPVPASHV